MTTKRSWACLLIVLIFGLALWAVTCAHIDSRVSKFRRDWDNRTMPFVQAVPFEGEGR